MWSTVLGLVALAALGWRLVHVFRRKQRQKAAATEFLFADVLGVVEEAVFEQRGANFFHSERDRGHSKESIFLRVHRHCDQKLLTTL